MDAQKSNRKRSSWTNRQVERALEVIQAKGAPPLVYRLKMSWLIGLLSAAMVFVAIAVTSGVGYGVASNSLMQSSEVALEDQANTLLADEGFIKNLKADPKEDRLRTSSLRSPGLYMMVARPDPTSQNPDAVQIKLGSDHITLEQEDIDVIYGRSSFSQRQARSRLVLTTATGVEDWSLVLVQDLAALRSMTSHMAVVFVIVAGIGALIALMAGWAVARTSLVPVQVLIEGTERIAETDDLTPLPVYGSDEMTHLTESFNDMLRSLQESRVRQSQLVADAGHELKTPLTSLRTNIELLMMASRSTQAMISDEDTADLERDVLGQLEELTTLVTDLVDLAREDASEAVYEPLGVGDILDGVIDRVERRRSDVNFQYDLIDWYLMGDHRGLSRAFLNILDNAAKWSPQGGTVRMQMRQIARNRVSISVHDEGPGIPEKDRELVFERFYRSVESRSMPGSGLGLAIVKQVMESHGGSVRAIRSPYGGACMVLELPGGPDLDDETSTDIV